MAIVGNTQCPECAKNGHDKSANHLMQFDDGGMYCNRASFHTSGEPYYVAPDGTNPIIEGEINGKIKYSIEQFEELEREGKIRDEFTRQLALGGMRERDRYQVMSEEEKASLESEWASDVKHFDTLKVKHLIGRQIHGKYAKMYNIRVGHDAQGKVARHYYPKYEAGEVVGAKCRNLPKDFKFGHLGKQWGDFELFGEHTLPEVLASGRRMDTLVLTGGECDAAAAQEMLCESQKGTKYEGTLFHVWAPTDGENAVEQIRRRKSAINAFKKIIVAFDDDDTGQKMNREVARIFPTKTVKLVFPSGTKDPNDCLKRGLEQAFVDAWWNPKEVFEGVNVKSVHSIKDELKAGQPKPGLGWPWPSMDHLTLGIRPHQLILYGAGSGVGKTEVLRHIVKHLVEEHGESVGVISTEDPYVKVARSFIGKWINKRIELPPNNDPSSRGYRLAFNYTKEEVDDVIDYVAGLNKLFFADLSDSRSIDAVMEQVEEFYTMGVKHIIIDNLVGIEVKQDGKGNEREGIDEALKTFGLYKDNKEVTIHLVSHLKTVGLGRTPHEEGGEVQLSDFRGSRAIGFWASYAIAVQRNTQADTIEEKTTTYIKIVKDRDQGLYTGEKVILLGQESTGNLLEPSQRRVSTTVDKTRTTEETNTDAFG